MERKDGWRARIKDINHRGDYTMPNLCYEFMENGKVIGEVHIFSSHMLIAVKKHGLDAEFWTIGSTSYAFNAIKEKMAEGLPPGIEEALEIMSEIRKNGRMVDVESSKEVYDGIKSRWEELISSSGISMQKAS